MRFTRSRQSDICRPLRATPLCLKTRHTGHGCICDVHTRILHRHSRISVNSHTSIEHTQGARFEHDASLSDGPMRRAVSSAKLAGGMPSLHWTPIETALSLTSHACVASRRNSTRRLRRQTGVCEAARGFVPCVLDGDGNTSCSRLSRERGIYTTACTRIADSHPQFAALADLPGLAAPGGPRVSW